MSPDPLFITALKADLSARLDRWSAPGAARRAAGKRVPALTGRVPAPLPLGKRTAADHMAMGRYVFDGEEVNVGDASPWAIEPPSPAWAETLHGFGWLADFHAADGGAARRYARAAVEDWIKRCGRYHAIAWRPHIVGRRLRNWLLHSELLRKKGDDDVILRSLGAQTRYLAARWERAPEGVPTIEALVGLAYAELFLSDMQTKRKRATAALLREIDAQVAADGGHASRRPSTLLDLTLLLIELRRNGADGGLDALSPAIERMAIMLRLLRHGDGGLALFNGGREAADGAVDLALFESGSKMRPPMLASDTGFVRIAAGRTIALMDAGRRPDGPLSAHAHAEALAIEVSFGRRRMIVSCGSGAHLGENWRRACRATAAHSTACIAETSSDRHLENGYAARRLGPQMIGGPTSFDIDCTSDANGNWAQAAHDGYLADFGVLHARRLYLSTDGYDLRGEDTIAAEDAHRRQWDRAMTRLGGDAPGMPYAIRFHLHPDIDARLEALSEMVELRFPSGDLWIMRQVGGELQLEESVYIAEPGQNPRAAKQIVVFARAVEYWGQVKWAFKRANPHGRAPRDLADDLEQIAAPAHHPAAGAASAIR